MLFYFLFSVQKYSGIKKYRLNSFFKFSVTVFQIGRYSTKQLMAINIKGLALKTYSVTHLLK